MKRNLLLSLLTLSALLCGGVAFSQTQPRSRAVYGELLGASQGIGISYDARFRKGAVDGFGWRVGAGFGYSYSSTLVAFTIKEDVVDIYHELFRFAIPLEVNYLIGKGPSKFETGFGSGLCLDHYTSKTGAKPETSFGFFAPHLSLGYRLVTRKGFLFRAGVLPTLSNGSVSVYPYLAFGKAF